MVAGIGLEPMTFGLWARRATNCSTPRQYGGGRWIRTIEGERRQIYSLLPLATRESHHLLEPTIGLEPTTYWLQVSCSTNWATSACSTERSWLYQTTSVLSSLFHFPKGAKLFKNLTTRLVYHSHYRNAIGKWNIFSISPINFLMPFSKPFVIRGGLKKTHQSIS